MSHQLRREGALSPRQLLPLLSALHRNPFRRRLAKVVEGHQHSFGIRIVTDCEPSEKAAEQRQYNSQLKRANVTSKSIREFDGEPSPWMEAGVVPHFMDFSVGAAHQPR
jgi:hypothetical protein